MKSAVGAGAATVAVTPSSGTATVNFDVSQTLAALLIGNGGVVNVGEEQTGSSLVAEAGVFASEQSFAIAAQAVPKPGSLSLLAAALLILLRRPSHRSHRRV